MKRKPINGFYATIVFILLCIAMACLCSCTKKVYIPVEKENIVYRVDTLKQVQLRYDSIFVRDSTSLVQRGDTIFLTKYRDQAKYIYRTDTIYRSKLDSVYIKEPVPYEVIKEVPRPLKWWQKTLIWLGVAFFALLAFVVYRVIRKRTP